MKISKEEFEIEYIKNSRITKEFYDKHFVTLKCECLEDSCQGWACVSKNPEFINRHEELYK